MATAHAVAHYQAQAAMAPSLPCAWPGLINEDAEAAQDEASEAIGKAYADEQWRDKQELYLRTVIAMAQAEINKAIRALDGWHEGDNADPDYAQTLMDGAAKLLGGEV